MKENIFGTSITYIQNNGQEILIRFFGGIVIGIILYIIIKYIVKKVKKKIAGDTLIPDIYAQKNAKLVGGILFILLMIFNILTTFQIIGFDVAIIMGGISLSIGFAMETTIGNMIAGIFILTNKKIKLGDFVEFLGVLKIKGTIEEVNIRYTVIRSFDKRRTIVPNSIIAKTPIRTLKSEPIIKGEIGFSISRDTSLTLIKEIYKDIIKQKKEIIYPEYANITIEKFDTNGIELKGFFFVNPKIKTPFSVGREIKISLFKETKKRNIKIPYKHISISIE